MSIKFDADSQDVLDRRKARGEKLLDLAWGKKPIEDERESAARDAISFVLTALFGHAGHYDDAEGEWKLRPNRYALNEARRFIEGAVESWENDAEDYYYPEGA